MDVIGLSIAVLACGLLARHLIKIRHYKERHRANAENAFRSLSLNAKDSQFSLTGDAAEVIDDSESIEQMNGVLLAYALTRIARNQNGEYFWFQFRTDAAPLIKHIDQSRAKTLLKAKYVAPPKNH